MRRSFRAAIRARATLVLVLGVLGSVAVPSAALASVTRDCTPPVATRIVTTTGRVAANQPVGFTIGGRIEAGNCAHRSLSFELPPQLAPVRQTGAVIDASGRNIGRVTSHRSSRVEVTLDSSARGGSFAAAFVARLRYSVSPNTRLHLHWRSGSTEIDTGVLRTAPCAHCRHPRRKAVGRAVLNGTDVDFTLESMRSRTSGEHVRFSVHLAKTLRVRCAHAAAAHLGRNGLGAWGELRLAERLPVRDLRCVHDHALFNRGGTLVTGWVRLPRAHRYASISVPAQVRDAQTDSFPVWGTVGQRHERSGVAVTARRYLTLLRPSVDLVPVRKETASAPASPRPDPRPTQTSPSAQEDQNERGPVVATTLAILAAGLAVLVFGMRRRSS